MSLNIAFHDKYKRPAPETIREKQVCIHCGYTRMFDTPVLRVNGKVYKPNTTTKILKGFIGPTPGSFLGCILGLHDLYFERELERANNN